jgi:hypothetical protein
MWWVVVILDRYLSEANHGFSTCQSGKAYFDTDSTVKKQSTISFSLPSAFYSDDTPSPDWWNPHVWHCRCRPVGREGEGEGEGEGDRPCLRIAHTFPASALAVRTGRLSQRGTSIGSRCDRDLNYPPAADIRKGDCCEHGFKKGDLTKSVLSHELTLIGFSCSCSTALSS